MSAVTVARPEFGKEQPFSSPRRRRIRRTEWWVYVLLVPTVVLYGLFTVYPVIASYWYSFVDWNGFEAVKTFVGPAADFAFPDWEPGTDYDQEAF